VITGTTGPGKNTFLTRGPYGDFELEFEVRCDPELNSGVQIRSHVYREATPQESKPQRIREQGEVYGYQCEITSKTNGENGCAGNFWDEGRRTQWLDSTVNAEQKQAAYKAGEWNQFRVIAQGNRIRSFVNGVPVAELVPKQDEEPRDRRWVLTREQRLTSMATLPEDNIIIDGALWSDASRPEVSVERDFATDLGVAVGDSVVFNVQGVPLELLVSSIRTVEWERFSINFFLVVEPGVLDEAPRYRIATARLAPAAELPVQNQLAASHPNVTMLRIRDLLEKIVTVLEQVGFGVRFLGAFTVLAGIAILAGAISAGAVRRGRQVALYKTLGMTRAQVASVFAVEYALIGLVAGLLGTVGGVALAVAVIRFGFEIAWAWLPTVYAASVAATVGLSVVAGLAASTRALAVRPLTVLRQGDG